MEKGVAEGLKASMVLGLQSHEHGWSMELIIEEDWVESSQIMNAHRIEWREVK
jgi:hypothetical protein